MVQERHGGRKPDAAGPAVDAILGISGGGSLPGSHCPASHFKPDEICAENSAELPRELREVYVFPPSAQTGSKSPTREIDRSHQCHPKRKGDRDPHGQHNSKIARIGGKSVSRTGNRFPSGHAAAFKRCRCQWASILHLCVRPVLCTWQKVGAP